MTRRRELNWIAGNLLGQFVSRNNDVGGYWAIGKLCAHALLTSQRQISIDLLSRRALPEFEALVDQYGRLLVTSLQKRSFPIRRVTAAELLISFGEPFKPAALRPSGVLPYRCSVTLTGKADGTVKAFRLRPHSLRRWRLFAE